MKNGIIAAKLGANDVHIQYPWSAIEYIYISKGPFLLKPSTDSREVSLLPDVHPEDRIILDNKWPIYTARGDIPQTVAFVAGKSVSPARTKKGLGKIALELGGALVIWFGAVSFLRDGEPSLGVYIRA
jgi:hypothetical protein